MATVTQVMTGLAQICSDAVYPNGIGQPSVAGVDIAVFPGWPVKAQLDDDLIAGKVQVSIFPGSASKDKTLLNIGSQTKSINAPSLIMTFNGTDSLTFTGTPVVGEAATVSVNKVTYGYEVQTGDTLSDVATNLAALIPEGTAAGDDINFAGVWRLQGGISVEGELVKAVKRVSQIFKITVWAPDFNLRDVVYNAIDIGVTLKEHYDMGDGLFSTIRYNGVNFTDQLELNRVYRADLTFTVNYATTQSSVSNTIVVTDETLTVESPI